MWRSLFRSWTKGYSSSPLFGTRGDPVFRLLSAFVQMVEKRSYEIVPLYDFENLLKSDDLGPANRLYWEELFCRAHFGASVALLRTWEWVAGARDAHRQSNVFVLGAALRGALEAAADTYHAFQHVPLTLATNHVAIRQAIGGSLSQVWNFAPELETLLYHFTYAKRIESDDELRLVEAKSAKEYVDTLKPLDATAGDIYAGLCQITHPSVSTVFRFGREEERAGRLRVTLDPTAGAEVIQSLTTMSEPIGRLIIEASIKPCVATLRVLNRLGHQAVSTPWAETTGFEATEEWKEIEARLRDVSPRPYGLVKEQTWDELRRLASPARKRRRGDPREP